MPEIAIRRAEAADDDVVTELAFEYLSWAIERLRAEYGVEWPPLTADDVREGVVEFRSEGTVLLAMRAGLPVGIGAVHLLSEDVAEVKRMYVRDDARGFHIGSMLFDELIDAAEAMGAHTIRLDTIKFMTDAQRLYRSRGFVERSPYEGTEIPEPYQPHWLFFERIAKP